VSRKSDPRRTDTRRIKGSGNVFLDLGFDPAEAKIMALRAEVMIRLEQHLKAKGWTQSEAARRLGISQPRVSRLIRGKWQDFSLDMLLTLAARAKRGKGAGKVGTVHLAPEERTPLEQRAAMTWARRLKRVFNIVITECEKCKGPVKVIACIEDPVVIDKILNHLKAREAKQASPSTQLPPPRAPPLLPGWEQGLAD